MALETLKITELGLECYVLEKVPPQMGKSLYMVRSEGLEPPTPWFEAKYSIQLSYERVFMTKYGGPCKNRTYDTEIKSLLLYRLS